MTRKDFVTKFMELINTTSIGKDTCYMILYKYPSGRFCLSFESYHTNITFLRVHGTNLALMMTNALKEIERLNDRKSIDDVLNGRDSLERPQGYKLTPEQIGIVAKGLKELRKRKVKRQSKKK